MAHTHTHAENGGGAGTYESCEAIGNPREDGGDYRWRDTEPAGVEPLHQRTVHPGLQDKDTLGMERIHLRQLQCCPLPGLKTTNNHQGMSRGDESHCCCHRDAR